MIPKQIMQENAGNDNHRCPRNYKKECEGKNMGNIQQITTNFFEKLEEPLNNFGSNKYLKSLSGGMMATLPITLIGSIASLLNTIPVDFIRNGIQALGLGMILNNVYALTMGMLALYAAFFIAKSVVQQFSPDEDSSLVGVTSLLSFLILTPLMLLPDGVGVIPITWLGAQGVFSAIIVGLFVGRVYVLIREKGWFIKMPAGVPAMVTATFEGLIPSIIISTFFVIVSRLFESTSFGTFHNVIYTILQKPLTSIGGSFSAMLLLCIFGQLLWFFGIHGTSVIFPIAMPIWMTMDVQNLEAVMAGVQPPNIIGAAFFSTVTFGGTALGLVINMLMSKSKQYKQLGKISIVPALFGITEPVIFGTPLVMNFKFAFPFIFNNAIALCIAYGLTVLGIVPRFIGAQSPMGLPVGFSAAMQGSIMIIVLQLMIQVISILLWRPFFKMQEKEALEKEAFEEEELKTAVV